MPQSKKRASYISFWSAILLFLGLLTPAAEPVTIQAADSVDDVISVEEALERDNDESEASVEGHIVGEVKSEDNVIQEDFNGDTNVALADDPEETDTDKMVYVQVTQEFRDDFGLKSNSDNLDEEIIVKGNLKEYFSANGLKDTKEMSFSDEEKPEDPDDGEDPDDNKGVMIHDIQGESHESPMIDENVQDVEGIITYKYDIYGSNYFHMQTPEDDYDGDSKTSEGIVVYTGKEEDVEVGDQVKVDGQVDEFHIDGYDDKEETDLSVTEINARDDQGGDVSVTEEGVDLPDPVKVTSSDIPDELNGEDELGTLEPEESAIDYWESIEGMRVEVAPSQAVAPQEHGDLFVKTDDHDAGVETDNGGVRLTEDEPDPQTISFKLQPNDEGEDFAVKTGDHFNDAVTGIVNYGFGNYKVYADLEDMENAFEEGDTEPHSTSIENTDDELTVAGYNVENFSANENQGETPPEKAENIARAFVEDMDAPDIVGVVEMQDNNGQEEGPDDADASESYDRLIEEIEEQGGPEYDYANINPEYNEDGGAPDGNIRVGFLYNSERVSLKDGEKGGATDAVEYADGELSHNPGRVEPDAFDGTRKPLAAQFEFNGESVVVVANHLNSKLGDDPAFGQNQPPEQESREKRNNLAETLNGFIKGIEEENADENVVVLGDINDFEFSEPLSKLKGDELTNLVDDVPENDQYSYVHEGNSQVLDHMLVSNNLADGAEFDMVHINADFTDMHGRASDHDPVLAQLDLDSEEEDNGDGEEDFDLSLMHMNDTHAHVEPLPNMLTAIKEYREENDNTMLFHGGDVFSGTLYFNEFKGQADLSLLNMMDIDAMVFGNHEFDLGDKEDGHESLSEFTNKADFPMLGSNIDFSEDPFMTDLIKEESPVSMDEQSEDDENIYNSMIKEVDGEKIGVFGLTTEDTEDIGSPEEVEFVDFKASAEKAIDELEDEGVNKIIAVNHIGYDSDPSVGNDLRLASEVDGIDVIVGGHSHTELEEPVLVDEDEDGDDKDPTVIVQAGEYAEHLGTLDVTFDEDGVVKEHSGELLDVDDFEADEAAEEELEGYKEKIDEVENEEIGAVAKKDLTNPRQDEPGDDSVRANETELGNVVTDAMLAKAQEKFPETEIAMQNGGGIREAIDEGPITTGEVISVLPFGNDPVIVDLSGEEIKDILEYSVRHAPEENGGFLHISGMQYYYDSTKDEGERVVDMYVKEDGELEPIEDDETYLITTNGFTGQGGDGFDTFAEAYDDGRVKDIGEVDWEQFRDYMVEEEYLDGVVDPEREDRIVDLEGEDPPADPEDPDNGEEEVKKEEQKSDDESKDDQEQASGIGDKSDDDHKGDQLPDTASDIFNYLLIGAIFILAGGALLLYRRKVKVMK